MNTILSELKNRLWLAGVLGLVLTPACFAQTAEAHFNKGYQFQKLRKYKEALEDYKQYVLLSESSRDKDVRAAISLVRERMEELSSRVHLL